MVVNVLSMQQTPHSTVIETSFVHIALYNNPIKLAAKKILLAIFVHRKYFLDMAFCFSRVSLYFLSRSSNDSSFSFSILMRSCSYINFGKYYFKLCLS